VSRPASNVRLFVAAYPPPDIARLLLAQVQRLALPPKARLTPVEQVHMTLQFIGDTPSGEMEATMESVRRAAAGLPAFPLVLQRLIRLPERGPARLIAAETDAPPTLLELQRRLATRLARNVRARASGRFTPHLSVCRFAAPQPSFSMPESAVAMPGSFNVDRIHLMRSALSNAGATHHETLVVPLA
jgi:2'-5' RNA ligase